MKFLGLDIGTTTVTAVVLDAEEGRLISVSSHANTAETTSPSDPGLGRSEWDANEMFALAGVAMRDAMCPVDRVEGVGVTGQMHGTVLVNSECDPTAPFIGWQDQRGLEPHPEGRGNYVERMQMLAEDAGARGCRPTAGYLGTTLYWLSLNERPVKPFTATFIPDFVVSRLTDTDPVTDPTDAVGTGLFDVHEGGYSSGLLEALGLDEENLPRVVKPASQAGSVSSEVAERIGVKAGTPVFVACGDNQASFAGSVSEYGSSVLVNVGTGGQASCHAEEAVTVGELEARPFMDGGFLWVGAGLVGGRTYAWLRDVFRQIGLELFDGSGDEELYDRMNTLASKVAPGCDGLRCTPVLTGTRQDPECRARWEGVGTSNFTPGHMVRAVLEGMADQFGVLYDEMLEHGARKRTRLVGAGNGVRKNPLLREMLSDRIGMKMEVPTHTEEAAYGAALTAAVGGGYFRNYAEAGKVIRYD